MSFGLLNNPPPFFSILHQLGLPIFLVIYIYIHIILEADCLVSQQFNFYGVRLLAARPTLSLEDQAIPLCLAPTLDMSGMCDPTSSYATAGIALRVSGTLQPHHHDKVETPSMVVKEVSINKYNLSFSELSSFSIPWGSVRLIPLGTSATIKRILPAPDDG
jgi:hypothetical protein